MDKCNQTTHDCSSDECHSDTDDSKLACSIEYSSAHCMSDSEGVLYNDTFPKEEGAAVTSSHTSLFEKKEVFAPTTV